MFPQELSLTGSEQVKIESREYAERKNQSPYCVQPQVGCRLLRVRYLGAYAVCRGVYDLQKLCGHRHILRDNLANPRRRRVFRMEFSGHLLIEQRQAGNILYAGDKTLERSVLKQVR